MKREREKRVSSSSSSSSSREREKKKSPMARQLDLILQSATIRLLTSQSFSVLSVLEYATVFAAGCGHRNV